MSIIQWGSNKASQLIGFEGSFIAEPSVANGYYLEDQRPIQVAAGDEHTLVLTETGDVFSFGNMKIGNSYRKQGIKVPGLDHETIVHIAAGANSSYAVSNAGKVYQW
jgi:alpha-tubulin suppressor-like RCC1 family protein